MCFYYTITKRNPESLIGMGVIGPQQLELLSDHFLVNGFEHPAMPIITDASPKGISFYRWGMLPNSTQSQTDATKFLGQYNTLNAHADRIFGSKLYGESIRNRRCLVLCSGFFEWRRVRGEKIPYFISLRNDSLFAFAGIWSSWSDERDQSHGTYAIITTEANELLAQIHNTKKRMPVILPPEKAQRWIDPQLGNNEIQSMLAPVGSQALKAHTVEQFLRSGASHHGSSRVIEYYPYPGISELLLEGSNTETPEAGTQLRLNL